ncbi:secretin N-terminal domain-containing protein [Denitromonas iodatirespirans]|uniref:NolW-like domain-containing protein n=1 Tax=Denitromonas iodatirespirans TaxID=2795389 RepID=A0A944DB86_DENI1|nr:secretin N-terminal domain-containing protein [Denitromonas iodatirespirans]MBT0961363.1 hypothetical protein [Denitromonas iodatirespirans]
MVAAICLAPAAHAALPLTIITLQHRSVDEVLPALRPLLSPGGQLSGINDKLLIRTDADNLRQLREALAAVDTPPARLRIELRTDRVGSELRRDIGIGGEVRSGDVTVRLPGQVPRRGASVDIGGVRAGVGESSRSMRRSGTQFVETRDGGAATLFVGTSVPLAFHQVFVRPDGVRVVRGTVYQDVGEGVLVRPTVVGQRVRLVLSPESSRQAGDGRIDVMRLETTVEGRLGEWIAVGGASAAEDTRESRGVVIGGSSSADSQSDAAFWLRVDTVGGARD